MKFAAREPAEVKRWQEESRKVLFDLLKLADLQATRQARAESVPFEARILRSEDRGKFVWSERELNSTPKRRIKVVLTVPANAGESRRWPAVVCIHGHGGNRLVVYNRKTIYHGFAADLAEHGFVTIATDVGQHSVHEQGRTLMGERLWDVLRCADYVASLPEVDAKRLGCAGLSLGGEMAMWLGAMDPRMKATVSSGFLTTMANMRKGHCPCWEFPGLADNFDFSDIYSLTAPRALLCQNGQKERAPGGFPVTLAEQAMSEIRKAYSVFKSADHAVLEVHPGGHEFVTESGVRFLEQYLR
jgi:dienelactone hydrolase